MEVNIFVTCFVEEEEEEGEESSRGLEVIQEETLELKVCIICLFITFFIKNFMFASFPSHIRLA
jgi:hypothetical protein